ncbi:MAG: hypothetical protein Q8P67_27450 [archaeon]|nr:hypothetical protein [archaeon]
MALAESTSLPPLRSVSPVPSSVAPSLPTLSEGAAAAAASFSFPPATQALQRQWKLVKNALLAAAKASASSPAYEPAAASGESPLLAAANPMTARLRREDVSALRAFHRALVNSAPSPAAFGVSVKTIDTLAELLIFRRAFGRPLRVLILAVLCEMWPSFCLAAAAGSDSGLPSVPQFLRVSLRDQTVDPIIDGGLFAALLSCM